ncbi:hypothetical protein Trydic_g17977 [Trypoxylus dichotomus]
MVLIENVKLVRSDRTKQYIITIAVALSGICVGTSLTWTSPTLPQLIEKNIIVKSQECIIGSLLPLGAVISAIPVGYLADLIGRRKTLIVSQIPILVSLALIWLFSYNLPVLFTARFLAGMGCGAMFVSAPMYIGEIAETKIRGKLISFFELSECIGTLLTVTLGAVVDFRLLTLILGILATMFASLLFFIPESPTYLLKIGKTSQAVKELKYFRGEEYANVEKELSEMEHLLKLTKSRKTKFKDLFTTTSNRKATIASLGIMAFRQLSGIEAVMFYTVIIFMNTGNNFSPYLGTIIVDTIQVCSACCAVIVIEKAERRFFLKLSSIGMGISLAIIGAYSHSEDYIQLNVFNVELLPVLSLTMFVIAFTLGYGPVPLAVINELFTSEIKGKATGLAIMVNWLFVFIVTLAFPLMNTNLGGHVTFYTFAAFMVVATVFVQLFVPETRGKTLETIQFELGEIE